MKGRCKKNIELIQHLELKCGTPKCYIKLTAALGAI